MSTEQEGVVVPTKGKIDFHLGSQVVGSFPDYPLPTIDGAYRYEPYRGPGHFNLHEQLEAGKTPRCFYDTATQRVWFCVIGSETPGVLELVGFEVKDAYNQTPP
jgi:hypothetical protein